MSSLREPGLGPIVGHVTPTSARVWIRADDPEDAGAEIARHRRTIGVATIKPTKGRDPAAVYYFRLQREYDRTGLFTFGVDGGLGNRRSSPKLDPDTSYEVRVGTFTIDDPNPYDDSISDDALAERLPPAKVWHGELYGLDADRSLATFKTFAERKPEQTEELSFILGSCRYPGLLWKAKHSDEIFGPMLTEALGKERRRAVEFILMVGDQIYADMLNRHVPIGLATTFEEFQERYLTAFGSPRMRALLRSVPTYMILDDHEIEDNWTQDRINRMESRRVFNLAIGAYMSYQWYHGPRNYGKRLFYDFECGGYPFFVLDTRTQRFVDDVSDSLEDNHLLGRPSLSPDDPSQLDFLLHWLESTKGHDVPKFIVTSSVFAPNPIGAREGREGGDERQRVKWKEESDSWPAFPSTRRAILECIVENAIQNVVFLSGDIHCSNVAEMRFSGSEQAKKLRAFSVTSSAFYWPFPFADGDPSGFVHDSVQPEQRDTFIIDDSHTMDYRARNFTQVDNFCRVDVDREKHTLTVRPYDRDGEPVETGGWFGRRSSKLVAKLELAPW